MTLCKKLGSRAGKLWPSSATTASSFGAVIKRFCAGKMPGFVVPMQARKSQSGRKQSAEQEAEFLRKAAALGIRVSPYYRRTSQ